MNAPAFTHFGRYRIVEELGRGAMGTVYLAEDETLLRQVAVKAMLLPADTVERAELEGRFRQEAKAAGSLNHPNVITIHDLGREGDWLYIAMELVRGTELRTLMQAGAMPLALALDLAAQVADGLAAAHVRGVVHRDIKPSNIMVLDGRHAKIMDFGVARMQASELRTRSGVMLGSPKYMSPEQVSGHAVDARSDIFALGSVLYEMVAGRPAFGGAELGSLLNGILHGTPPAPGSLRSEVPPLLDLIVARAMQKKPSARYQDAREFAADLQACRAEMTGTAMALDVDFAQGDPDATLPRSGTLGLAGGLAPAAGFDSTAALQRLLADLRDPAAATVPATARAVRSAWWLAWALAAGAAVAIAFT